MRKLKKWIATIVVVLGGAAVAFAAPAPAPETSLINTAYDQKYVNRAVLAAYMPFFEVIRAGSGVSGGLGVPVIDSTVIAFGSSDATKKLRFEVDGFTTGTTRVMTFPNANTTIAGQDFANTFSAIQTFSLAVRIADGTRAAPSLVFNTATTSGFYNTGAGGIGFSQNGTYNGAWGYGGQGYFQLPAAGTIGFQATSTDVGAEDLYMRRGAAALLSLGLDANGAPVNQAIKAHNGITGTDIAGASLTLESGLGTGAGVSGPLTLNRQVVKATGTTVQTYAPAFVTCPTKILSTASATAQTIATITTTTTTAGTVTLDFATTANNGTLQDQDSGMVKVSWGNNAGTVAATMTAIVLQSDQDASGTLATTPTATVATNVVSIKFTPTWVTIVPTTVTGYATFLVYSGADTVACQ